MCQSMYVAGVMMEAAGAPRRGTPRFCSYVAVDARAVYQPCHHLRSWHGPKSSAHAKAAIAVRHFQAAYDGQPCQLGRWRKVAAALVAARLFYAQCCIRHTLTKISLHEAADYMF